MDKNIIVSVVMPVYNEEKHIAKCIDSLLEQDYPLENMEWIFVDGMSKDRTVEILNGYREKYPQLIKVVNNPHRVVTYALNIGIANSVAKYAWQIKYAPGRISSRYAAALFKKR